MSIYENIAFGVRLYENLSRADMDNRVQWALEQAALWTEAKDKLHQSGLSLSGGQQQAPLHCTWRSGKAERAFAR